MTLGSLRRCVHDLPRLLRPGTRAHFSGATAEQAEELGELLQAAGFVPGAPIEEEGWVAMTAVRGLP
jgi:ribosomal protein L11 methylase PrmA